MTSSLCVCLTPLHVLIAAKIEAVNEIKFSKGVYLTYADNAKSKFYSKEMEKFCDSVDYIILPSEGDYPSPKYLYLFLRRLRFRIMFTTYGAVDTLYTGTSINQYLYALLSAVKFDRLVTFDDGVLNIKHDSELLIKDKWFVKLFFLISGISYWRARVISKSTQHYSIYQAANIFSNINKIKLIEINNNKKFINQSSSIVRIFLGPPPESSLEIWEKILQSIKEIKPNAYLPHPREINRRFPELEYVETELVAEHYVLNLLDVNPDTVYELYGYEGSALLNLAGLERIKVFSVMPINYECLESINLMRSAGINFLYA